jgi:3-deoxy-D-manno-octulosonate 8-phosphate phosphatase (KDO 8-P phosphatase)
MNDANSLTKLDRSELIITFKNIKLLCCDCDGVLTDGGLYYDATGHVMAKFHVLDGMGLKLLMKSGVKTCLITQSKTTAIDKRAEVLGLTYCLTGVENKFEAISKIIDELHISMDEVAHIADDVNDIPLLKAVGYPITVPNAVPEVKAISRYITERCGGEGAVRDLCDAILKVKEIKK